MEREVNGSTEVPITIGSNIASLRSQRQLFRASGELESVFSRLSSGQRINRASDDAAGLAIADSLRADGRVFTQGIRNLNDGLSILNVADGSLQELTNITFRLTELAEQAANGTLGVQQRAALDEEAQALSDEYFRIVQSTEFNGRTLFTADYGELRLQAGYGLEASLGQGLGGAIGTGEFLARNVFSVGNEPIAVTTGDFNGDGALDIVTSDLPDDSLSVLLGNGDGTFGASTSLSIGTNAQSVSVGDLNNDGVLDLVGVDLSDDTVSILLGNGDGTFGARSTFAVGNNPQSVSIADLNGDGVQDLVAANVSDDTVSVLLGNGDGSFAAQNTFSVGNSPADVVTADFNGDGILDIATPNRNGSNLSILLGAGDGTFGTQTTFAAPSFTSDLTVGDFNGDGIADLAGVSFNADSASVFLGNGDGSFSASTSFAVGNNPLSIETGDFNGDGILDLATADFLDATLSVLIGNGDGSFADANSFTVGTSTQAVGIGDFNGDGVLDLVSADRGNDTVSILLAETTDGISPLLDFSLGTIADARQALSQFTQNLDRLSTQRGELGAFQARIEVAENVLQVATENFQAAESRIRDADIAQEAAELVRLQILQQSSVAVLGQANLQPQLVLQLLNES